MHPLLSLLAASMMAALPVQAAAQPTTEDNVSVRNRPRAEFDPLGAHVGAFTLQAQVDVNAAATDNLFATETNEQDDFYMTYGVLARLVSGWSRHALQIDAGATVTSHNDFSTEDTSSRFIAAVGRLDVGSRSYVSANAGIGRFAEPRTSPDALTAFEPVEYTRREAAISAQHQFNRFRLRGTIANYDYNYDDAGPVDQDFRDIDETLAKLRAEAEITPRIGLVLEATADERDYPNSPGLSSNGRMYLAGISINMTDLMRGEFTIGQFERNYDFGGDTQGTAISGNIEWYVTRLTTLSFNASQSGEESGAFIALPFTDTQYGARVDHELQRNLILTAGVQFGQRDFEIIDRTDEFNTFDAGADFFLNRRVALNLRYRHDSMESTGVNRYRDFDVGTISAGVSLRL